MNVLLISFFILVAFFLSACNFPDQRMVTTQVNFISPYTETDSRPDGRGGDITLVVGVWGGEEHTLSFSNRNNKIPEKCGDLANVTVRVEQYEAASKNIGPYPWYGTRAFISYQTYGLCGENEYIIRNFSRGKQFDSARDNNGKIIISSNFETSRFLPEELETFKDTQGNMWTRTNPLAVVFSSGKSEFSKEVYVQYAGLTELNLVTSRGRMAHNATVQVKTCIFKKEEVPTMRAANNFGAAQACVDWESNYIYNYQSEMFSAAF